MTELIAVVSITILAVISPGPDFAMVTRNSLMRSRRAGVLTALGIGSGVLVHVGYTMLGVGLVIQQSIWLFNLIKFVGAAYLVYLGLRMMRSSPMKTPDSTPAPPLSDISAFRIGFLTNVLNPKTTVFIVSLFMQVVHSTTPLSIQISYGLFIAAAHIVWFTVVALCFSNGGARAALLGASHWIDRAFGVLLIFFGIALAGSTMVLEEPTGDPH